jgi:glucose-1-phosphate adenylyltransferase
MHAANTLSKIEKRKTLALVLGGGSGTRLQGLTRQRAKAALPFGGHHRVIDFALSNCVHSAIPDVAIVTQHEAPSLIRHLQRNWLSNGSNGTDAIEIWPARKHNGGSGYAGTADAVHRNRDLIEAIDPDDVLVIAGDQIYEMDYTHLLAAHNRNGADVTISCVAVPASDCRHFGIVEADATNQLTGFIAKPEWVRREADDEHRVMASMGIYTFSADYLLSCLDADAKDSESWHDFDHNIVPRVIGDANVFIAPFQTRDGKPGYWRDVDSVDSYWLAHMDLIDGVAFGSGMGRQWPLLGGAQAVGPARLTAAASVRNSIVSPNTHIAGHVRHSVVSTGCQVEQGATLTDSVLLPQATVGANCTLNRVIVDSRCHIADGTVIDADDLDAGADFHITPSGVVLVTAENLHYGLARAVCQTA